MLARWYELRPTPVRLLFLLRHPDSSRPRLIIQRWPQAVQRPSSSAQQMASRVEPDLATSAPTSVPHQHVAAYLISAPARLGSIVDTGLKTRSSHSLLMIRLLNLGVSIQPVCGLYVVAKPEPLSYHRLFRQRDISF